MYTVPATFLPYLLAGLTLLITFLLAILVSFVIGRLMRQSAPQVTASARRLGGVVIWVIGATLAIQNLGISPDVLLLIIALLGVAALVALREPLGNFGAKYFTDVYTPFKVGDSIRVVGVAGKVIEINAMSTMLLAENNELISVPNSTLIREVVVNTTPQAWKEVTVPITLNANIDLPAFEGDLLRSLSKLRLRLDQRFPPVLTTKSRSAQSTDLLLTLMLRRPEERDAITAEVNKRVVEVLERARAVRR
ncbi:MAG: mechanosensitive ion channel domain-containing protein [Candidatus Lutacidiplasmatales archaeon]